MVVCTPTHRERERVHVHNDARGWLAKRERVWPLNVGMRWLKRIRAFTTLFLLANGIHVHKRTHMMSSPPDNWKYRRLSNHHQSAETRRGFISVIIGSRYSFVWNTMPPAAAACMHMSKSNHAHTHFRAVAFFRKLTTTYTCTTDVCSLRVRLCGCVNALPLSTSSSSSSPLNSVYAVVIRRGKHAYAQCGRVFLGRDDDVEQVWRAAASLSGRCARRLHVCVLFRFGKGAGR